MGNQNDVINRFRDRRQTPTRRHNPPLSERYTHPKTVPGSGANSPSFREGIKNNSRPISPGEDSAIVDDECAVRYNSQSFEGSHLPDLRSSTSELITTLLQNDVHSWAQADQVVRPQIKNIRQAVNVIYQDNRNIKKNAIIQCGSIFDTANAIAQAEHDIKMLCQSDSLANKVGSVDSYLSKLCKGLQSEQLKWGSSDPSAELYGIQVQFQHFTTDLWSSIK